MVDIRFQTFLITTAILFFGTAYSVVNSSYLDTSNPLLTHLPHRLSGTHYFASKGNPLNVYFIKNSWGWTTLAFLFSYFTSPIPIRNNRRWIKYLTLTAIWVGFTGWFFGPALLDRFVVYSGGECLYQTPGGEMQSVPTEVCYSKLAIGPRTHPLLFTSTSFAQDLPSEFRVTPRLRRGHDISGHVFLLTMSVLFLADQLRASFQRGVRERWSQAHMWSIAGTIALMGIWFLGCLTTSVYFHSPFEKFTGYLLGVASFAVTQLPIFASQAQVHPAARRDGRAE